MDITQLILSSLIVGLSGVILYRQRKINRRLDHHDERFEDLREARKGHRNQIKAGFDRLDKRIDATQEEYTKQTHALRMRKKLTERIDDIEQQLGSQLDVVGQLVERGVGLLDDADARLAEIDRATTREQERRSAALKRLVKIGEGIEAKKAKS